MEDILRAFQYDNAVLGYTHYFSSVQFSAVRVLPVDLSPVLVLLQIIRGGSVGRRRDYSFEPTTTLIETYSNHDLMSGKGERPYKTL